MFSVCVILVCFFGLNSLPICVFFRLNITSFPTRGERPLLVVLLRVFITKTTKQNFIPAYCAHKEENNLKKREREANEKKNDPFSFHFRNVKMLWHFYCFGIWNVFEKRKKVKVNWNYFLLAWEVFLGWLGLCSWDVLCSRCENHKDKMSWNNNWFWYCTIFKSFLFWNSTSDFKIVFFFTFDPPPPPQISSIRTTN